MPNQYDFGGYATRHDVLCNDGRTIKEQAFADADGKRVPLVYHHIHDDISNVLGYADLEYRQDGVYANCSFNETEKAQMAKEAVRHKDITSLSIYANGLKQRAGDVLHGVIREVSLVLSGANPGAKIDNVAFKHGDGYQESEDDVIINSGFEIEFFHSTDAVDAKEETPAKKTEDVQTDTKKEEKMADEEKTLLEEFEALDPKTKTIVEAMVGLSVEAALSGDLDDVLGIENDDELAQSGIGGSMKKNVFDNTEVIDNEFTTLSHSDMENMFDDMKRGATFKETMLEHGITNVEVLFPEARGVNSTPETIARQQEWATEFLAAVKKSPFSRIKSTGMDLTEDDARAKGYVKGHEKAEQVITAFKRVTTPQTIYKKQKLDRDDVVDIVDFDVIAYVNAEMRVMINEELARAALIGDGRSSSDNDKINPLNIRPIWQDDSLYTTNKVIEVLSTLTLEQQASLFIDEAVRQRKYYKGSGRPTCYIGTDLLTACLLLKDTQGYRLYKTEQELADAMRVAKIVEVELFDSQTRVVADDTFALAAVIVNPMDYVIGADKGGEINNFEDFDIDFNQHKYLMETRASGALIKPKAALTFEFLTVAAPTEGGAQ